MASPLYYTTFKQWQWMVAWMAPKLFKTFQKTKQKVLIFTTFPFSISKLVFFHSLYLLKCLVSWTKLMWFGYFLLLQTSISWAKLGFFFQFLIDNLTNFNFISKIGFDQLSFLTILSLISISFTKLASICFLFAFDFYLVPMLP